MAKSNKDNKQSQGISEKGKIPSRCEFLRKPLTTAKKNYKPILLANIGTKFLNMELER